VVVFGPDATTVAYLARTLYPEVRLVRAAEPGEVAPIARRERAGLIVLDVNVDGGAGWQVAHALHADAVLEQVPLLILPAAGGQRGGTPALDLGVVAFASKLGAAAAPGADRVAPVDGAAPAAEGALTQADADRLTRAVGRAATTAPGRALPTGTPINVLVVDDDPDARRVTTAVLRAAQAAVREVPDGEAALAAMRARRPDVAVIDLMMPCSTASACSPPCAPTRGCAACRWWCSPPRRSPPRSAPTWRAPPSG
jgi:CheY-like chemotaxis protein